MNPKDTKDFDITEDTPFNNELLEIYTRHWSAADGDMKAAIMYALCLALGTSILFVTDGDERKADAATMAVEGHIRAIIAEFVKRQEKRAN